MKTKFFTQAKTAIAGTLFSAALLNAPVAQASDAPYNIDQYLDSMPLLGLIAPEVVYGPITIKDVSLNESGKLAFAKPGDRIKGKVKYKIDTASLNTFHLYHVIVGIKGLEEKSCITHSFGFWDDTGHANFDFMAPAEPGVYEVQFGYYEGEECSVAHDKWTPSSKATIACIIVQDPQ